MLKLFNTLTRKIEEFSAIGALPASSWGSPSGGKPMVGMYTCGPTVYGFAHIGNLRSFLFADILKRALLHDGYEVKHIMNITDVGHLTGDRDMGEDKLEKAAAAQSKSAWELASFYTDAFLKDIKDLNILNADKFPKATGHIKEMIELIKELERKGFTYKTSDGIYFDTLKSSDYGKLAQLDLEGLKEGARVEKNPEKKNPTDFALWKFSYPSPSPSHKGRGNSWAGSLPSVGRVREGGEKGVTRRQMEWQSPWGMGFPGWHIECSAMSVKYLGQPFDIHTGGVDHIPVHHTNEIAQSEAAYGNPLANYWLHNEHLLMAETKIAKSEGNTINLQDLKNKGYSPLAFRYFVLQGHYRTRLNFTWNGMDGAQNTLDNLFAAAAQAETAKIGCAEFESRFFEKINDDLNTPEGLAVMWEMLRSGYPPEAKLKSLLEFDKILGLSIEENWEQLRSPLPEEIEKLIQKREEARSGEDWKKADELRKEIEKQGFEIRDTEKGPITRRIK